MHQVSPKTDAALVGDLLCGGEAIAEFLFGDRKFRRKVYNLVEAARLPTFRLGNSIYARKSVLLDWIAAQEKSQTQSLFRAR
ncbi:helix-turn-helix domain-containing protein [Rhodovulum sp. PH10]|uniref:helix-turn-helix domain-containing protein n=1 Tax=Rhodovulum sp. PH10 TaxID=1187851 RepID=UPI0002F2BCC9|nr:helix-turn-helix domain-containing protein [Rhodovulum sp. PH10]